MGGLCSTRREVFMKVLLESLKGRGHSEDIGVEIKCDLNEISQDSVDWIKTGSEVGPVAVTSE